MQVRPKAKVVLLLALQVLVLASLATPSGRADTSDLTTGFLFWSGGTSVSCPFPPLLCSPTIAYGVQGATTVPGPTITIVFGVSKATFVAVPSGNTEAFWIGISSGKSWIQTGWYIGTGPDKANRTDAWYYVESNFQSSSTRYNFTALGPATIGKHTFEITMTTCLSVSCANIMIDNKTVTTVKNADFSSGSVSAFLESQETGGNGTNMLYSQWDGLRYADSTGTLHDFTNTSFLQGAPYFLYGAHDTGFSAGYQYTGRSRGGGGG